MPNPTTATDGEGGAQIAHAIPGRIRLRLAGAQWTAERLDALSAGLDALRAAPGIRDVELKRMARTVVIRYESNLLDQERVLALAGTAGLVPVTAVPSPGEPGEAPGGTSEAPGGTSETTEELAAFIGIPTSFDRRLAESLALSGVSLLAARWVGAALGGGTTLPAYFAIWFALRRTTGLGRRR